MTTETKTAHFRISGADFTRLARERVLDDAPGHAWRIAMCLGNDSDEDRQSGVADIALGILNGTKKLVGDEINMKPVKEDPKVRKEYLDEVNYIYAGRIRVGDRWYCPVAYVSDVGPRDMKNDHGRLVQRLGNNRGYSNRAWHYAGPDEIVHDAASYPDSKFPNIKREVIFRACGERPHWHDVPRDAQAALDEFLAVGHRLQERGHSLLYGTTAEEIWGDNPKPERVDVGSQAIVMAAERRERENAALKKGNLRLMNGRINAELELARELDEDDRPEVQRIRNDPQKGTRQAVIKQAYKKSLGLGTLTEMLDEYDPNALVEMAKHESELNEEYRLAQEIDNEADRQEAEEQIERERAALRQKRLDGLRDAILKQANGDLIDLSWPAATYSEDDTQVRVPAGAVKIPRAPFLHWAFSRMKMFDDQLPPWQTVCPPGLKMSNDDPFHTDWVVGAGLDPENRELLYYPGPLAEAALKLAHEFQDKFDRPSDVHVLVDGAIASGEVHHGKRKKPCPPGAIVVLPNLHPDFLATIEDAAAVITEEGGAVAHLVQVGRERALPIVRITNARERYEEGIMLIVNTSDRTVMGV